MKKRDVDHIKFVVDHNKINQTLELVIAGAKDCHFCNGSPIAIIYRGENDKIVLACKEHEEIVLEMIERAK